MSKKTKWNHVETRPTGNIVVIPSDGGQTYTFATEQVEITENRMIDNVLEYKKRTVQSDPLYAHECPELHWAFVIYEEARKALLREIKKRRDMPPLEKDNDEHGFCPKCDGTGIGFLTNYSRSTGNCSVCHGSGEVPKERKANNG